MGSCLKYLGRGEVSLETVFSGGRPPGGTDKINYVEWGDGIVRDVVRVK